MDFIEASISVTYMYIWLWMSYCSKYLKSNTGTISSRDPKQLTSKFSLFFKHIVIDHWIWELENNRLSTATSVAKTTETAVMNTIREGNKMQDCKVAGTNIAKTSSLEKISDRQRTQRTCVSNRKRQHEFRGPIDVFDVSLLQPCVTTRRSKLMFEKYTE